MANMSYNYTYTDPSGYSYSGQVVADTTMPQYDYVSGQSYKAASGGTYTVSGPGVATTAPSGAVYMTSYTAATGATAQDSYHYDPKNNAYYDINTGYDHATGMYQPPTPAGATAAPPTVPAWSGIGLGNEYSYVNTAPAGSPPTYSTYGGGGSADVNLHPTTPVTYDYQFMYTDGSYYDGTVMDNGTYGYKVGMTKAATDGTYSIYAQSTTPPAATEQAGYNYVDLYHSAATGQNYAPSDIISTSPTYQKADGYGGLGTEKDYASTPSGYQMFNSTTEASASTPIAAVPLPT
jgi:hypothetical protein